MNRGPALSYNKGKENCNQGSDTMDHHYAEPHEVMYHTQLSRALLMGADTALLPGDPGRVRSLAEAMGPTVDLTSHREYTSCLTQVQNQPVLVCSTGMGGPSTAICLEELARLGIRRVIRVGTTGSIQEAWNWEMW